MNRVIFFLLLTFGFHCSTNAQTLDINLQELTTTIDELVPSSVHDSTPGLVIGVMHKGNLIFQKGYGLANLSYQIPNTPKMLYNIGSVSKQFLGFAFAMLAVGQKLNLDDPVHQYLEDWPVFDHEVTLRHLLSHTSGYREAYTMSNLAGRTVGIDRLSRKECLDVVRRQPALEFVPGSRYTYNSTAWVILAEILEKVTEQPAHEWVKTNILKPLGMNNTYIESFVGEVIPHAAESYTNQKGGFSNSKSNRAIFGAAEVFTNLEDLLLWTNNFHSAKIGGKDAVELFLKTFQLNDGTDSGYGLGIENKIQNGVRVYSHNGGHESFITQLKYYPEHELGLVTISNYGPKGVVWLGKIESLLLKDFIKSEEEKYTPVELKSSLLKKYVGTYVNTVSNNFIKISLNNNTLTTWGGKSMLPTSETTFRLQDWDGKFQFKTAENQELHLTVINKTEEVFTKVPTWDFSPKELKEYIGDYWSEELETVYSFKLKEKQLVISHRWLSEIRLTPICQDFFRSNQGWYVQFIRDEENQLEGFQVNSGRTLMVFFQRKE